MRVKVCDLVCPSTTLPKLKIDGVTFKPIWTPVPLTGIVNADTPALLLIVTLPVTAPATVGANTTFNVTVADGARV